MLTKDDLKQIQKVVQDIVRPLEHRLLALESKVDDLIFEVKAIHKIIETQDDDFRQRIERLEEEAGIVSSS